MIDNPLRDPQDRRLPRVAGPCGCTGRPNIRPIRSAMPLSGWATRTVWLVEMFTTAGCSRATMSAKLIGAPGLGAMAAIAPGSFCAVCAFASGWSVRVAVAPPSSRAEVKAIA